jgi:hypothetical protein
MPTARGSDREVEVVAAILAAGSEKAAAQRLGPKRVTLIRNLYFSTALLTG